MLFINNQLVSTLSSFFFFFFNDTATTDIYTLSLHDALRSAAPSVVCLRHSERHDASSWPAGVGAAPGPATDWRRDRATRRRRGAASFDRAAGGERADSLERGARAWTLVGRRKPLLLGLHPARPAAAARARE